MWGKAQLKSDLNLWVQAVLQSELSTQHTGSVTGSRPGLVFCSCHLDLLMSLLLTLAYLITYINITTLLKSLPKR